MGRGRAPMLKASSLLWCGGTLPGALLRPANKQEWCTGITRRFPLGLARVRTCDAGRWTKRPKRPLDALSVDTSLCREKLSDPNISTRAKPRSSAAPPWCLWPGTGTWCTARPPPAGAGQGRVVDFGAVSCLLLAGYLVGLVGTSLARLYAFLTKHAQEELARPCGVLSVLGPCSLGGVGQRCIW